MIKQILFDCGGVLAELNFRELMLEISGSEETTDYFISHLWRPDSPWLRYDNGDLNTEQVMVELKNFMPCRYHNYLEEFVDRWLEALPPMAGMEEIVDALKERGYPCYLLSNFSEGFRKMPERTPVLQKLDGMVISYEVHLLKPDPAAFRYAADKFGYQLEETLFVDDHLPNVEAARRIGMAGYHFTTPAAFKAYLLETGIL